MSEDVVGEASSGTSGGVWEQSAGLRWQLVGEQEERIPSRSRSSSRRDGPVDPGLSIQGFLDSFTEEESVAQEGSSIVYHSDGNMLARIDTDLDAFVEPRRIKKKKKRRGPALSEEVEPEASTSAGGNENPACIGLEDVEEDASEEVETGSSSHHRPRTRARTRRWRSYKGYWKRRKEQQKKSKDAERGEKYQPTSVESSPGRRSPSPERLHQILTQRRLLLLQPLSPEYVPPSPDNND